MSSRISHGIYNAACAAGPITSSLSRSSITKVLPRPFTSCSHTPRVLLAPNTTRMAHQLNKEDVRYDTNSNRPVLPPDVVGNQPAQYTAKGVDDYLESKLVPKGEWANDPSLARSRKRADDAGVPAIAVSPLQGQFLAILAKSIGASKILEIGTLWGYSTTFLTRALPPSGQIDTLELSPVHAKVASETFLDADLYPFPKIHLGPALDTLKTLSPPGEIEGSQGYDLVFIDADKASIHEYFQESLRLTRKGGLIIVDNAIRGGRISGEVNDNPSVDVTGLRKLYDWIEKDNGKTVLASGIQTVGGKNWDGFAVAVKL